jgi:hypothetical protein
MQPFLLEIGKDFHPIPEKSVFENLFEEYEKIIFRSIITAFGLDLFIKDRDGGDVDTIHTVRDSAVEYKNEKNAFKYENRGLYQSKEYHKGGLYQQTKHEARENYTLYGETVIDAYTGNILGFYGKSKNAPHDRNAELDHVISAKTIHDDKGRVLAGINGGDLANAPENLEFTNESLNASMGVFQKNILKENPDAPMDASEIPGYIEKHSDLPQKTKDSMMEHYNKSKELYEKKIAKAYYLDLNNPSCRRFYFDTAAASVNTGLKMGARQVLGFVLTEVWFSIKDSLSTANEGFNEKISAIVEGIENGFKTAIEKYKDLISKFGEGFLSGMLASLNTTLCNIFFTTGKNIVRIIRQAWASIVEAAKIIFYNPEGLFFSDRMTDALKVLAAGAGVVIGTSVQEIVRSQLAAAPAFLADTVSIFAGTLCTGLLTVSLLFYIDNSPFDYFLLKAFNDTVGAFKKQAALFTDYCAELQSFDIERFRQETDAAYNLSKRLKNIGNDWELNAILESAALEMGIESPWGSGSFNMFMNDPESKLYFHV